jgi:hypothetical protein
MVSSILQAIPNLPVQALTLITWMVSRFFMYSRWVGGRAGGQAGKRVGGWVGEWWVGFGCGFSWAKCVSVSDICLL